MRPEVRDLVSEWHGLYLAELKGTILEVGSMDVNGSLRPIFKGQDYVGLDMRPGDNVDKVMNAHQLWPTFGAQSIQVVICCDTFEHDDAFWLTLDHIATVLRPGGYFLCSVPSIYFPNYHGHPDDYWRFTESAFQQILLPPQLYHMLAMERISTPARGPEPDTYAAIARRRP